jgi:hypothetical protein
MLNILEQNQFDNFVYGKPQDRLFELAKSEDILARSCAIHRLNDNNTFYSLDDDRLSAMVTDDDRKIAYNIRKYYSHLLVMLRLRDDNISKFRTDLLGFLQMPQNAYYQSMLGMIYSLPKFYSYDTKMDYIKTKYGFEILGGNLDMYSRVKKHLTLKPIEVTHRKTSRVNENEYWMSSTEESLPVKLSVDTKNKLLHLWTAIFNTGAEFTLDGTYTLRRDSRFHYLQLTDWSVKA